MSEHLTAMGWPVHLIQGGGEIRCSGRKSGGWRIGVKDPRRPDAVAASLRLDSGRAVSTSGDYERFFLRNGVRYHHIMDPRTAAPARGGSVATTVLCAKSVACDALSTALFVLGPRRGKTAAQRAGVEAFWIRETPEGLCGLATAGWGTRLSLAKGLATCREPW